MSHPPAVRNRLYGSSLCLRCVGCRFVLGKRQQTYFMCELKEPRYPVQPQHSCRDARALPTVRLEAVVEGRQLFEPLCWVGPLPHRTLTCTLGEQLDWRGLNLEGVEALQPRAAPASALLWSPMGEGGEPSRGRLVWSADPQRGLVLAWSERRLELSHGTLIKLRVEG